jgi:hypothetical protein
MLLVREWTVENILVDEKAFDCYLSSGMLEQLNIIVGSPLAGLVNLNDNPDAKQWLIRK